MRLGELLSFQNPDSSLLYLDSAYQLSQRINDPSSIAKSLLLSAITYEGISDYDTALVLNREAYDVYLGLQDTIFMADALGNIGLVYESLGDREEALRNHLEALRLYESQTDYLGMGKANNNLGILYKTMGDLEKASDYYEKAAEAFAHRDFPFGVGALLNNAANVQYEAGEYEAALQNGRKSLRIFIEQNIEQYQPSSLAVVGASLFQLGQLADAADTLKVAVSLHEKYGNQKELAIVYDQLAELEQSRGDYPVAKQYAEQALENALSVNSKDEIAKVYKRLSALEKQLGEFEVALAYFELHKVYGDSLLNEKNLEILERLETQFETEQKEKQLAKQDLKLANQDLELANQEASLQRQRIQMGSLGGGMILLVLLGLIYYNQSRNRQKRILQEAVITEQERGLEAVFVATEDERKRIAKDLHDGVGQQLTALKRGFEELSKELVMEQQEQVNRLQGLLDETAHDTREISHRMMPRALTELGLVPAIEDTLNKALPPSSIQFEFEYFNLETRYDERKEVAVFRILQELVNNIIKHSGANHVNVQLYQSQRNLILVVEDNGQGMRKASADGIGILNIKNRINTLHGRVNLEATEDSGTTATVSVPV